VLQGRTFKELDILRQEIKLLRKIDCMTHDQRAQLDKMELQEDNIMAAIGFLLQTRNHEPVPPTWHGVAVDANTQPIDEESEAALRQQLQKARTPAKKTNRPKRYNK